MAWLLAQGDDVVPIPCSRGRRRGGRAGKDVNALASELPSRNGRAIAGQCGDRSPDCAQRLVNRASRDEKAAMSQVRKYAMAGLDQAARRWVCVHMIKGVHPAQWPC